MPYNGKRISATPHNPRAADKCKKEEESSHMNDLLYIVVPCYNEEEVLPETSKRLKIKMATLVSAGKISSKSRVLFVDDGSKDKTWDIIEQLHKTDSVFSGLRLSRNRGHQNALLAGLLSAKEKADMTISMDADLQDDIDAVDEMVDKYLDGCEVVYGVRSKRDTDTFFKRTTAEGYYKVINAMGVEVVFNHADYRLLSRRALESLAEYGESNLFLRGIIPMLGYKSDVVTYERGERFAGESKYPLGKMLGLAVDGITSLSIKPLRFILAMGIFMLMLTMALFVAFLIRHFMGYTIFSWKIVTLFILFVGSLILMALGILGEYSGKTYLESKNRPRYFIRELLDTDEEK